jgi:hypothetical protein
MTVRCARTPPATGRGCSPPPRRPSRRTGWTSGSRRSPAARASARGAIFEDRLAELERLAEEAAGEEDAWEALARFLAAAARMQASNQGFLDVMAQRMGPGVLGAAHRRRFLEALGAPLARAQGARRVRADLVAEDIPLVLRMLGSTTRPAPDGQPMDERWPRYLGLLLDALRPEAATPLPAEPWRAR